MSTRFSMFSQGPGSPLVQTLTGHEAAVAGALLLPDGRALSWSDDRTVRTWDIEGESAGMKFYFDATPTAIVADLPRGILVGDALGRIHLLEHLDAEPTSHPSREARQCDP